MAAIQWDSLNKQFCVQFGTGDSREALLTALRAVPEANISKAAASESIPVEPTPNNIFVLWACNYDWHGAAEHEALERIMPVVRKHLNASED